LLSENIKNRESWECSAWFWVNSVGAFQERAALIRIRLGWMTRRSICASSGLSVLSVISR